MYVYYRVAILFIFLLSLHTDTVQPMYSSSYCCGNSELTNTDTFGLSLWQVNSSARGGVRFVGSVLQQVSGVSNGRVHSPKGGCRSPPRTPPRTPPGDGELEEHTYSPGTAITTATITI